MDSGLSFPLSQICFSRNCAVHMYVRGIPFETYDGENTPTEVAVLDNVLTPSDAGPIEVVFEPKVFVLSP
jgi:hypothetical protein